MATNLNSLSVEEKLRLVQDLWRSIAVDEAAVPAHPRHIAEAEERLAQYRIDGDRGLPVREAVQRIRDEL